MNSNSFEIFIADKSHLGFADVITKEMAESAKARGTGIAKRSPEYVRTKIAEGKAVIALGPNKEWAGFCYIEAWGHGKYVANSGLIVAPAYRKFGLAKKIKEEIFLLSRRKFPESKIFGLTTGAAVMKINSRLGYIPVSYSDLTDDEAFWKGCNSCVNYEILQSKNRENCICTAMLFDPKSTQNQSQDLALRKDFKKKISLFDRWVKIKRYTLLKIKKSRKSGFKLF